MGAGPFETMAQDAAVAPLMRLLASGRVPKERLPQVFEMICKRGGPTELAAVFEKTVSDEGLPKELRAKALTWLADAAENRKVKPDANTDAVAKILAAGEAAKSPELSLAALKLATAWKVEAAAAEIRNLAESGKTPEKLRVAAIDAMSAFGGDQAKEVLVSLATGESTAAIRFLAVASLARIDLATGAQVAAKVLSTADANDDPTPMINTFFQIKGGTEELAKAIKGAKLNADVAKQVLRVMFAIGSSDAELADMLSEKAGIAASPTPPTQEEALKIATEVSAKGNAARGEQIFRRADLSCMNCHAVSRAGGQVGPELSSVGRISPIDYIVTSILNPNLAIKEQFVTRIIETVDGKLVTGVVADRDDVRVVLKTADGKVVTIPTADIDTEEEGKSLMPQGITKFLTQQEFYDLAKFVSELGKEGGAFALPSVPSIQRWRVLRDPSAELTMGVPNVEQIREYVLDLPAEDWQSVYAKVSGELPLDEVRKKQSGDVLYLMGEVAVTVAGPVRLKIESTDKFMLWVDATPFEGQSEVVTELSEGRHKLIFRIEKSESESPKIRVQLTKPEESSAQFDVVGGA